MGCAAIRRLGSTFYVWKAEHGNLDKITHALVPHKEGRGTEVLDLWRRYSLV